ncbi:PAS domain-containing sensor histidine kinase [Candidatus Roizmanbacteria bacterium]|nr:PAS domain-containing sensor histidine kinase [Candidatus Roizmanbacteria bacterium]
MSILLFILLLLLILAVIGAFILYFQRLNSKNQSEKKVHELEALLGKVQTELDKDVQILGQSKEKNQYETYAGQIVSQMNEGVICIDQNRTIQLVNTYAEKFLEISPAINKLYQQALHFLINETRDYSLFEAALSGKNQTLPGNAEIVTQHRKIPVLGTITPLISDNIVKTTVFIFADNSQNVSKIQEEKAFFSAAAHELRTPLTGIRMSVSLLLQQFDTLGREKIIEYLKKTNDSIEYLVNLVNDFLNVSRIDQGRLAVNSKSLNMVTLTDEVVREISLLAKERKLYIRHESIEGEVRNVFADPIKSKEVLTNLISNSIKYTIQGGITITHQVTDTSLITRISDTGNGIPKESQNLLFKRFFQIGGARNQSSAKSTGLGLYISKKIAQLMHGEVALETSEPGKGSTFAFTLPLVQK